MKSCWNCSAAFKMALGLMNGTTDCLPKTKPWVDSLIDREAGEGYHLYSLFDNMEDWRRIPPGEVPSILGWENWLRYVESHGYTRQEIEQLLRYEGKSHGEILLEIWGGNQCHTV